MLTFARKKKDVIDKEAIEKIVEEVAGSARPEVALKNIRKSKVFIESRMSGASVKESKALANYTGTTKELLSNPAAQALLEQLLAKEIGDDKMVKRLKEMWEAADFTYNMRSKVFYKKPNWDVRKFAFEQVKELRGYKRGGKEGSDDGAKTLPTQIVFNVMPIPQMPKPVEGKVIDVKLEPGV